MLKSEPTASLSCHARLYGGADMWGAAACLDSRLEGDQGAVALGSGQVQGLPRAQHGGRGTLEGAQKASQHILSTACNSAGIVSGIVQAQQRTIYHNAHRT